MLVHDIIRHHGRVRKGQPALVFEGEVVSYGRLLERVDRWRETLLRAGVRKGDRLAVFSRTNPDYLTLLFAALSLGVWFCPVNVILKKPEIERILGDFSPDLLYADSPLVEVAEEAASRVSPVRGIFTVTEEGELSYRGRKESGASSPEKISPDDVAMVVYTGGFGKRPKGAMLTHENIVSASFFSAVELSLSPADTYLSTFPLPFLAGTGRLMKFFLVGARVVLMDSFDPEKAVRYTKEYGVTHLLLVPQMMKEMTEVLKGRGEKLSGVRQISYSGIVPVQPNVVRECVEVIPADFVQSFAQVESSGVISFLHLERETVEKGESLSGLLSSVGKESVGLEVRVENPMGEELPPGEIGELVVAGATVMKGYYEDPLLTEEKIRDGRLRTGYVASKDEEGYLYVVDRLQDIIIRGGFIIDPSEVEEVISEFEGVAEVAVVGAPDEKYGEVPVALIVPEGGEFAPEKLLTYLKETLASFKVPARVEVVPRLPRNSQGKILKARLKEYLIDRA
ncbi:MAG: hypothetical protein D6713_07670 [Deltaproteobacteria bacterium]|nr:MAG: hypothetical protein D6713_07670 [Deltaproteobacteria bacterium]